MTDDLQKLKDDNTLLSKANGKLLGDVCRLHDEIALLKIELAIKRPEKIPFPHRLRPGP